MKKIVACSLLSLLFLSCSVSAPDNSSPSPQTPLLGGAGVGSLHPSLIKYNFAELEKEYKSFSTKALSDAYVKRMFGKYLTGTVNSVQLTRQLEFSRYLKNNGDTSFETSLKSMFIETPALYDLLAGNTAISAKITAESATFGAFVKNLSPYNKSCLDLKNQGILTNGVYQIDQDNNPATPKINVYCDMTTNGGGWTLVSAQYENDTALWNEGIQADYDPTLATKKGFALNSSQLPVDRTQTAFGRDFLSNDIDYADFVYTTGDIPKTLLTGKRTAYSYHIHRNTGGYYGSHDPEDVLGFTTTSAQWNNTLTFDRTGGPFYTWAFVPQHPTATSRGYAYYSYLDGISQSYAWTVWVR